MKDKYLFLFCAGMSVVFFTLTTMVWFHEFAISEIAFIIGICIMGFAYAKMPKDRAQIHAEQISKNIQTLNDILWGDEKKP